MSEKTTNPYMNKYEFAAIISERAVEIANGQPITIQDPCTTDPIKIAMLEFKAGKSPKKIKRVNTDGTFEIWALNEFELL